MTNPAVDDLSETPSGATEDNEAIAVAPQWRLVVRRFRAHKLAVGSLFVILAIYLIAIFASSIAPYSTDHFNADYGYAPPQPLQLSESGLFVYGYSMTQDSETLAYSYQTDTSQRIQVGLFVQGEPYRLLGVIPADIHLIGPIEPGAPMYLLGADKGGHDQFSRMVHGTRISMSIGLVGVAFAFLLGTVLGAISGYVGGRADTAIQRVVEFFMSFPTLPLWLGLAAALPPAWGPVQRYFAISVILSIIAWTDLARVVRGRFLSLREEQFVEAAQLDGSRESRVIFRHMLPSLTSHLIASLTLSVPAMILAETSLSFLGLGLQAPVVSWGVLLQEAQNVRTISSAPWLLLPGVAVIITVLALNFVGDGMRDAADPYKR